MEPYWGGYKRSNIVELMLEAGGEYGNLETIKIKNPETRLGYRYRYVAETLIASRIAAYEFKYDVIWEFNDQDELSVCQLTIGSLTESRT